MKKKLLIRILLGFLLGMAAMLLVPAILNGAPVGTGLYSDKLLARAGSPEAQTHGGGAFALSVAAVEMH